MNESVTSYLNNNFYDRLIVEPVGDNQYQLILKHKRRPVLTSDNKEDLEFIANNTSNKTAIRLREGNLNSIEIKHDTVLDFNIIQLVVNGDIIYSYEESVNVGAIRKLYGLFKKYNIGIYGGSSDESKSN